MEFKSLEEGGPRVKFSLVRNGTVTELLEGGYLTYKEFRSTSTELGTALTELSKWGATPILPDGKVAGNGSVLIKSGNSDYLVVSKSGKTADELFNPDKDVCIVTKFDAENWNAEYYSNDEFVVPTSDTPLHYSILTAHRYFGWSEIPTVALHGHVLDSLEDAERLRLPCSPEETLFSTPDDLRALLRLMEKFPYPDNKIYIRRGHGFFILGESIADAMDVFRQVVIPYLIDSQNKTKISTI